MKNDLNSVRLSIPCLGAVAAVWALLAAGPIVNADVIYETQDPFGGAFGVLGFDVYELQSVGARFTSGGDYTLDVIRIWLWNNDEGGGTPPLHVELRDDLVIDGESFPGDNVLEKWDIKLPFTGLFNPILFDFDSQQFPTLEAGQRYWITAESDTAGLIDAVWALAANDQGWSSTTDCFGCPWEQAFFGVVPATIVEGTLVAIDIPGDLDGDGIVGTADLVLLLGAWGRCDDCEDCNADLDQDCFVGPGDLILLLGNWG